MNQRLFPEFALLPEVFDPAHFDSSQAHRIALRALCQTLDRQGLVRNLNLAGRDFLAESLGRAGGCIESRMLLTFILKRKLGVPFPECGGSDWMDEAVLSHHRRPLAVLVTDELQVCDEPPSIPLTELPTMPPNSAWVTSMEIETSADAVAECIEPMLHFARDLQLIDPYFDITERRCGEMLRSMILRTLKNSSRPKIHIHCSQQHLLKGHRSLDLWRQAMDRDCSKVGHWMASVGRGAQIYVWDATQVDGGFHARYVLSEFAGCTFDRSFQAMHDLRTVVVLLSADTRRAVQRRFDPVMSCDDGLVLNLSLGCP